MSVTICHTALALVALWVLGPRPAQADPGAWTSSLTLTHAAFDVPDAIPDAVVHVPEGFDAGTPLHIVVLLHGWSCCAASFVGSAPCSPADPASRGWGVARFHDRAGTNSVLVAPQLALLARDSSPGRFAEPGFFRAWLAEVLAGPLAERLGARRGPDDVGSVTLVAHSAGYQTALAILEHGEVPIASVVLLDALYSGTERFAGWLAAGTGRKVVSVHTRLRSTARQSALLARLVRARLGRRAVAVAPIAALASSLPTHAAVIAETPFGHGEVPARHLAEILAGLGLPARHVNGGGRRSSPGSRP